MLRQCRDVAAEAGRRRAWGCGPPAACRAHTPLGQWAERLQSGPEPASGGQEPALQPGRRGSRPWYVRVWHGRAGMGPRRRGRRERVSPRRLQARTLGVVLSLCAARTPQMGTWKAPTRSAGRSVGGSGRCGNSITRCDWRCRGERGALGNGGTGRRVTEPGPEGEGGGGMIPGGGEVHFHNRARCIQPGYCWPTDLDSNPPSLQGTGGAGCGGADGTGSRRARRTRALQRCVVRWPRRRPRRRPLPPTKLARELAQPLGPLAEAASSDERN